MKNKAQLNARAIAKELTKCRINPNGKTATDVFDKMLVDVNNMDFFVLRTQELAGHLRHFREMEKVQSLMPIAQQYKIAQDIIKLMTIFCAYAIKEYPQLETIDGIKGVCRTKRQILASCGVNPDAKTS